VSRARQASRPRAGQPVGGAGRTLTHQTDPRRRNLRPRPGARVYQRGAQQQLQRFRRGSLLAVAITALLLLLWGVPLGVEGQEQPQEPPAVEFVPPDPAAAVDEAADTIRDLAYGFFAFMPRLIIVLAIVGLAALVSRAVHSVLRRTAGRWERVEAASALTRLIVYLLAVVASLSVLAGDARAVVGSVGLLGLAASWALQTPIESFTGWLLNSFRAYYRVGDRISVGDLFGDVYRIDVLTTTVWEAGGPGKSVTAAQATGVLITFPNWEILRSHIVNYSREFPYVWDEITLQVANESDMRYTIEIIERTAHRVIGDDMAEAARRYEVLLAAKRLAFDVDEKPRAFLSLADSWTDCTVRYLIPVRERRRWSSALVLAMSEELARPEHKGRILPVYPRTEVKLHEQWPTAGQGDDGDGAADRQE
jgi:small conductance mechanosensitive channel